MQRWDKRGLSLVELLVALLLAGLLGSAVVAIVTTSLRSVRTQAARAQIRATLRTAVTILASELRELGSGISHGGLIDIEVDAITYRAMRSTAFLCRQPDPRAPTVTAWGDPIYGLRPVEAGRDSLLLFADNDPRTPDDDEWRRALVVGVTTGDLCPGPSPGVRLRLAGLAPGSLVEVEQGAPIRGFQATRLVLYQDARRTWWLGLREYRVATGWSITQPVLGPLSRGGLRFEYLDDTGTPVDDPQAVAVVGVTVVAIGSRGATSVTPAGSAAADSVSMHIALRNCSRTVAGPAPP